jgi:elongation factor Ts
MSITAAQVKELRERTGAGMMECKRALVETGGDMDSAVELMRKQGLAKADKKAGRVAAEGRIVMASSDDGAALAMVEINCETDFVAGGDDLIEFGEQVAAVILTQGPADLDALAEASLDSGESIDQKRRELIARIGEKISVRRFQRFATDGGILGSYKHGDRIGVVVELSGGDSVLARDLAMHVAASKPICVDSDQVPAETMAQEKSILVAQAEGSGKPAEIVEKMVEGRIRKWLAEITLVGQPFVKDPDVTVGKLVGKADAKIVRFARMEVGEGIEKKQEDFVAEVRAQAEGR